MTAEANNADYCPEYLEHVESRENGYVSVSFIDEVVLIVRVA